MLRTSLLVPTTVEYRPVEIRDEDALQRLYEELRVTLNGGFRLTVSVLATPAQQASTQQLRCRHCHTVGHATRRYGGCALHRSHHSPGQERTPPRSDRRANYHASPQPQAHQRPAYTRLETAVQTPPAADPITTTRPPDPHRLSTCASSQSPPLPPVRIQQPTFTRVMHADHQRSTAPADDLLTNDSPQEQTRQPARGRKKTAVPQLSPPWPPDLVAMPARPEVQSPAETSPLSSYQRPVRRKRKKKDGGG